MAFSAGLTVQIKLPFNPQTSNFSIVGNKRVQKLKLQLSHCLHQTHITAALRPASAAFMRAFQGDLLVDYHHLTSADSLC